MLNVLTAETWSLPLKRDERGIYMADYGIDSDISVLIARRSISSIKGTRV